jgi:hypothetical protein
VRGFTIGVVLSVAAIAAACGAPAALNPDQIVPAFIAASQSDVRTMHMEWQGGVNQTGGGDLGSGLGMMSSTFNGSFDFNGPDYAGGITSSTAGVGGSASQVSYARVSGVAFINYGNSGWQRADAVLQPVMEIDPLRGLAAPDVSYEAADTLTGRAVHRLRVGDPLAALGGALFPTGSFASVTIVPGGKSDYLVYVDAAGIPVAAHLAVDMTMTPPEGGPSIPGLSYSLNFDYQFTLWAEPVTISPPQVTNNGGGIDFPPAPRVQPNF